MPPPRAFLSIGFSLYTILITNQVAGKDRYLTWLCRARLGADSSRGDAACHRLLLFFRGAMVIPPCYEFAVRSLSGTVGAQLTQSFILPFGLPNKWVDYVGNPRGGKLW